MRNDNPKKSAICKLLIRSVDDYPHRGGPSPHRPVNLDRRQVGEATGSVQYNFMRNQNRLREIAAFIIVLIATVVFAN